VEKEKERRETEKVQALEFDERARMMAKEYAVLERQMLLLQISALLLFVEDLPSIILNGIVYLPSGGEVLRGAESILGKRAAFAKYVGDKTCANPPPPTRRFTHRRRTS